LLFLSACPAGRNGDTGTKGNTGSTTHIDASAIYVDGGSAIFDGGTPKVDPNPLSAAINGIAIRLAPNQPEPTLEVFLPNAIVGSAKPRPFHFGVQLEPTTGKDSGPWVTLEDELSVAPEEWDRLQDASEGRQYRLFYKLSQLSEAARAPCSYVAVRAMIFAKGSSEPIVGVGDTVRLPGPSCAADPMTVTGEFPKPRMRRPPPGAEPP
jgi:hypothetical protein